MKGRDRFTTGEADQIRQLLRAVRRAEPGSPQKMLRDELRALGFYISDWGGGPLGFTASDFDDLVTRRLIVIGEGKLDPGPGGATGATRSTPPTSIREPSPAPAGSVKDHLEAACEALTGARISISTATPGSVPNRPGLYALYGDATVWRELGLDSPPDERPLYVGKAEKSLESRDLKQHFATGKTGWSSPRRSFAALLSANGALDLVPVPRRPENPEPTKWTHFALEATGDEQLTRWMRDRLSMCVWAAPAGTKLESVESAVMRRWKPPLNLIGVETPWRTHVRDARARLAERSRAKWEDSQLGG